MDGILDIAYRTLGLDRGHPTPTRETALAIGNHEEVEDEQMVLDDREELVEDEEETGDSSNRKNPLLRLPNDLILCITDFLEPQYQLSLRRSCQRFHLLLGRSPRLNLALQDLSTKMRFLRCLEPDYPDLLPCRACGTMYKWRAHYIPFNTCPRKCDHVAPMADLALTSFGMPGNPFLIVNASLVDLVLRGFELGGQYGLPLSCLRSRGVDSQGFLFENLARVIDGELVLASRREVISVAQDRLEHRVIMLVLETSCSHFFVKKYRLREIQSAIRRGSSGEYSDMLKCNICETDMQLQITRKDDGGLGVVLFTWWNCGRRVGNRRGCKQLFIITERPLSRKVVARRNLCALFQSAMRLNKPQSVAQSSSCRNLYYQRISVASR